MSDSVGSVDSVGLKEETQEWNPNWQLWCIFAVIGLLNFVTALDATSISVALPVRVPSLPVVDPILTSAILDHF